MDISIACASTAISRHKLKVVSHIENQFTLYMTEVVTAVINYITNLEIRKLRGFWIRGVDLFCSKLSNNILVY